MKNEKGFAPVVVAVVLGIVVAVGYVGYQYITETPTSDAGGAQPVKQEAPLESNFEMGGMLFDENRVTGAKEWTFMYDEPGRLAILVKLNFTESSTCDFGMGVGACMLGDYNVDDYTDAYFDLSGYKEGNEVTVISLVVNRY